MLALVPWQCHEWDRRWGWVPAVLDEAFASEVLAPPVRRDKPEPRAAAIKQLMEAKDRRVFKRVLKALCGGKKKGVAGAPPAT